MWPGPFGEAAFLDVAVLLEQFGRAAAPTPFVHATVAAGLALASAELRLAKEAAAGTAVVAPVPLAYRGNPKQSGSAPDGWWWAVPWTFLATHYLLPAPRGLALVEAASGVSSERQLSSGLEPLGRVSATGARVLRKFDQSFAQNVLLNGAAASAMLMAGASSRALDVAVDFMKQRVQFGKPIGAFQALQHRAADMAIQTEASRYLSFKAASTHGR